MFFPTNHPTLTFNKRFTFNSIEARTSMIATVEIVASEIPSYCGNGTKRSISKRQQGGACYSAYIQWSGICGGQDK